jgi:hypothetical protein
VDNLFSTAQVAVALGVTPARVSVLARRRGVGQMIGSQRIFTQADLESLRPGKTGRPPENVMTGSLVEIVAHLEEIGAIDDVSQVRIVVRPRPERDIVLCKVKNKDGKVLHIVKSK